MYKLIRCVFLSLEICLLIFQVALADPYHHATTGIVFPDHIATLEKEEQITDYEAENPGLGVGVGYNAPGITVTVYIYTMGNKIIPTDLKSSVLMNHFSLVSGEIVKTGSMGYYSDVMRISENEIVWSDDRMGTKSLHASFNYNQHGQDRVSHLYLLSIENNFLKVRFTYDKEIKESAEKLQKEFLEEFSSILNSNYLRNK